MIGSGYKLGIIHGSYTTPTPYIIFSIPQNLQGVLWKEIIFMDTFTYILVIIGAMTVATSIMKIIDWIDHPKKRRV